MNSKEASRFLDEAALAVAFYDKCLFYSNEFPNSLTDSKKGAFGFQQFVTEVERLREREKRAVASGVTPGVARRVINRIARVRYYKYCSIIGDIYNAGLKLLDTRLTDVLDGYGASKRRLERYRISITDRGFSRAKASLMLASERYKALLAAIFQNLSEADPQTLVSVSQYYSNEWKVLRECGSMFMMEISYLSGRVDAFNGYFNARIGSLLTIAGIVIGSLLTVTGIVVPIIFTLIMQSSSSSERASKLDQGRSVTETYVLDKLADVRATQVAEIATVQSMSISIEKLRDKLSEIKELVALTAAKNNEVKAELASGDKAIKIQDENFNKTVNAFQLKIETLGIQLDQVKRYGELKAALDGARKSKMINEFERLRSQIDALANSINDLKVAVAKKENPRVDINLPRQEPSKKTMGLINVQRN